MTTANTWRALDLEWADLCDSFADHRPPTSWGMALPAAALPPTIRPQNLLPDLCDLVAKRDDDVTAGLIRLAQGGDQVAGRVVIQALLPMLWATSRRDSSHDMSEYVSTAWLRLMTFPVDRRPSALLVNLGLDCLKKLSRQRQHHAREVVAPWLSDPSATLTHTPLWDAPPDGVGAYIDLLLDVAHKEGLVSPASVGVLRSVYRDGLTGCQAAERHGISHDMVRYRCSQAVKALRVNRQQLLTTLGSW